MNGKKTVTVLTLAGAVFLLTSTLYLLGGFTRLDNVVYDATVRLMRMDKSVSDDVAVILIDDQSLTALNDVVGRLPWPRTIYSDLLEFLSMGGARAVLFDVLLTEYQDSPKDNSILGDDQHLVSATRETEGVYHAVNILKGEPDEKNPTLLNRPLPEDFVRKFSVRNIRPPLDYEPVNDIFYIPFQELYQASHGIGVVEFKDDSDGVFRRTRPIREYQGSFFPVMGLAPLIGGEQVVMEKNSIRIGARSIPLDRSGNYILNFYGQYRPYSISGVFLSLYKIRQGEGEDLMVDPGVFENKIVFVGRSSFGIEDLKPTPIAPRTPGVFLHATLASNFIVNDFLTPPGPEKTIVAIVLLSLISTAGIFYVKKYVWKFFLPVATLGLWAGFYLIRFHYNILYEAVPPAAAVVFSNVASFGFLLITEGRKKMKVRKMLSRHVAPEVLSLVTDKYDKIGSSDFGSTEDITVLFCDIRGFTSFSDCTPPEQVVKMLNCFFTAMTDVIFEHRGTVDKYMGDAIMAFWGAPIRMEAHPDMAVMTALDMVERLDDLNRELAEKGVDFEVRIGIGVNSGDAILGNIGSERKLNYTVVGDTVNLASYLQDMTKQYNCSIVISEHTYNRLGYNIKCRLIDAVEVRGRAGQVGIYEPLSCELQ